MNIANRRNIILNTVRVILLNISQISESQRTIMSFLDEPDIDKADRFIKDEDRLLSLGGSYLIKKYAGGRKIVGAYGKPHSDEIFFNISHSADLVGIALSESGEVGLDLEKDEDYTEDVMKYCLSDEELGHLSECGFLQMFVSKESLVKAEGTGIPNDIKNVPALPLEGKVSFKGKNYYRHIIIKNGYRISVTREGGDFETIMEEHYDIR